MKQLRKSDLFVANKVIRFGDDTKKAVLQDYALLCPRCDIECFLHTHLEPLTRT